MASLITYPHNNNKYNNKFFTPLLYPGMEMMSYRTSQDPFLPIKEFTKNRKHEIYQKYLFLKQIYFLTF